MQNINDDCLMKIFEFLTLKEQMTVYQTCPRFHWPLRRLWRVRYKRLKDYSIAKLDDIEFEILISSICATAEEIYDDYDRLDILEKYTFPRVFHLLTNWDYYLHEDVLIWNKILPNLRSLHYRCDSSNRLNSLPFDGLKELELHYCSFSDCKLQQLIERLQLETLEIVNCRISGDIKPLCKGLQHLKKLRVSKNSKDSCFLLSEESFRRLSSLKILIFNDGRNSANVRRLCELVAKYCPNTSVEIEVTFDPRYIHIPEMLYVDLRRLKLKDISNSYSIGNTLQFVCALTTLRELHIKKCNIEEICLVNLLKNSQMLDKITVERCTGLTCNGKLRLNVGDIVKGRTKQLTFKFLENVFQLKNDSYEWDAELLGESHLLKINQLPCKRICI